MINTQTIYNKCSNCTNDTGASWKTLCIACWRSRSPDEVRVQRQEKLNRKVARLRKWADGRDTKSEHETAAFRSHHGDISFFTQPNINSSGGRAFTRSRQLILNKYDYGMKLSIEADEMREKAEWLEKRGAIVKGDAERARQARRDALDTIIKIGTKVAYPLFVQPFGVVTRVNKKTYTVKFEHGPQYALEKSFMKLDDREGVKT